MVNWAVFPDKFNVASPFENFCPTAVGTCTKSNCCPFWKTFAIVTVPAVVKATRKRELSSHTKSNVPEAANGAGLVGAAGAFGAVGIGIVGAAVVGIGITMFVGNGQVDMKRGTAIDAASMIPN